MVDQVQDKQGETLVADLITAFDTDAFDLAPVSLWLEDYSDLRAHFEALRVQGVTSLADYFAEDAARISACAARLHVIKVNKCTLDLFEAQGLDDLVGNLDRVFGVDSLAVHATELVALWNGQTAFSSRTVNYTLSGRRLDVEIKGTVLPGYERSLGRVLVAVQDITEREQARRQLLTSERYARGLFEFSPVSLWVEDFSAIRRLLTEVRQRGIVDFPVFLDVHNEFIHRCISEIRVIDVNDYTLRLFRAPDRQTLLESTRDIFRDRMERPFAEQLKHLWDGHLFHQLEVINYSLTGEEIYLHLQFSVMPGHEDDWAMVLIALTDITARKKAEAYLEFLGKHDELTKLYNRSFHVEEINRLERRGQYPISIIMIDLNGLKEVNDDWGHQAGDALLRRAGEVLNKAVAEPSFACRIGGDEFAILMPKADEAAAHTLMMQIEELFAINNQFYSTPLRAAMGCATAREGMRLEQAIRIADQAMYDAKQSYYSGSADAAAPERRSRPR
ncbi:sensor domain-containing diguanylate cyclase [Acidisoma cellulosilytica]|uniref:diguanylate cyclase n=1 Tax=Acidisoma cellulosilyticum TaxID=2802395 RepID=A0A964E351_9PROT|nr:sensor domain-containing diguanylate cyclase [Acidisoma cellulosilyticum]MCB8879917.1 sensor domain-containing diguanylate cyclase [Acidisoma cellulosilyticum]